MGSTIGLKDVVNIIKKRFILIMAVTAVITIIAAFISFFLLTPVYQASTQVLVNKSKDEQQLYNVGEIQTNIQLIDTYSEIIKSPIILEKVKTQLNLKQSNEALSNKIDIVSKGNSQIFTIKVKNTDPKLAVAIANSLTEIFQKEIKPLMNVDNVNILSKASLGENPKQIEPNSLSNTIFALWFGGVIGLSFAFLLEFLDNTIKVEADIDEQLKIPVLGIVNVMDNRKEKKRKSTS
ncbi:capsular biosynthesis protein [Bacillus sp. CRN 9]|nr:capsular biosynthesis protein [Bacillus sp. CRN 9]